MRGKEEGGVKHGEQIGSMKRQDEQMTCNAEYIMDVVQRGERGGSEVGWRRAKPG